jgi:hypothetical protein
MVAHGHVPPPEPGAPGIFAMAERERIASLLSGAGFGAPRIEEVAVEWRFGDFDDYWNFLRQFAGSLALIIERLDENQRMEVRETAERNAEPFQQSDGGYVLPGVALNAVAS